MRPLFSLAAAALAAALFSGCGSTSKSARTDGYSDESLDAEVAYSDAAGLAMEAAPMAKSEASFAKPSRARLGGLKMKSAAPAPLAAPPEPEAPAARMVSHSGNMTLRSPEPEKLLDSISALAQAWGGYVESRSRGWMALRVPAARFDSAFEALLRLGDVIHFSQSAEDITADFRDTELRQKVVGAAVARLEALVERARTDVHKLRLLGELKRYREEWEALEGQKKALLKKAEFASITVAVQGHSPHLAGAEADFPAFAWIRALDPFNPDSRRGKKLRFATPKGLVATSGSGLWRATASEGAEMWARNLKSKLRGDSRFWQKAVLRRLKDQFKSVDTLEAGGFLFCRFTSHGPRTYSYWVGVQSFQGCLRVVEFYFPDEKQKERHTEAMLAAVKQGPRKWYQRS